METHSKINGLKHKIECIETYLPKVLNKTSIDLKLIVAGNYDFYASIDSENA